MRIVSFTFDDGLLNSAKIMIKLKIPCTFYIVTGWVTKDCFIEDEINQDLDHGSIKDWVNLSDKGLDVGSHGHSHKIFNNKEYFEQDALKSFSIIKENFNKPYNFSFPYGEKKFNFLKFNSVKLGFFKLFNKITSKEISSLNLFYDYNKKIEQIIDFMPNNSWLVLTFHGIREGWLPCDEDYLINIYELCIKKKISIKTISEVISMKSFF